MAIDFTRVIQAAAESVLDDKSSGSGSRKQESEGSGKRGMTMPRAFLIGAGLFTAGRLVVGSRGRDMLDNLQERLVEYEERHFGSENGDEAEGYEDEGPEAEEEEEPEAEEDEDFDEEYVEDEEPVAEENEDPEAEEDEDPEAEEEEEPEADEDEDFDEE